MTAGDSFQRRQIDRNRLNQRNFRARRQAYTQELEQRVRKLENDGIQATKEVQAAAQRVDIENHFLRWLLETRFGVDASQINKYVAEFNSAADVYKRTHLSGDGMTLPRVSKDSASSLLSPEKRAETLMVRAIQDSRLAEATSAHGDGSRSVGTGPAPPKSESEVGPRIVSSTDMDPPQTEPVGSFVRLSGHRPPTALEIPSPVECQPHDGRCGPGLGHSCHPSLPNVRLRRSSTAVEEDPDTHVGETSCEEAAKIIASLRGYNTHEDIWNELGCDTRHGCRVKNLSVFELMDRE